MHSKHKHLLCQAEVVAEALAGQMAEKDWEELSGTH